MISVGSISTIRNDARPVVRTQLDETALAIIDEIEPIPEGYDFEGNPNWSGPTENFWKEIVTRSEQLVQLLKICQADFPTFCAVFLRITSKETLAMRPFIFNCAQYYLWNSHIIPLMRLGNPVWVVILKSRQVGISTLVCAWQFWQIWRANDIEVLMVGNTKKVVETFIDYFRMFHDELPNIDWVRPKTRAEKHGQGRIPKHEAYFDDRRSKASIMVDKNFSTRGLHAISFQLSEGAHYDDLENVLLTLKPLLPPLGSTAWKRSSIWIETTPRGQNYFYEIYELAKSGKSSYHAVFIPFMISEDMFSATPPVGWRMSAKMKDLQQRFSVERMKHDGKPFTREQSYWYEKESADQGYNMDMMEQEYPSNDNDCFLLTTKSVFKESLKWLQNCCSISEGLVQNEWAKRDVKVDPKSNYVAGTIEFPEPPKPFGPRTAPPKFTPKFRIIPGGHLKVWSPPQRGHVYAGGIDPGGGTGNDSSTCFIIDCTEGVQVAEFKDATIGPEELADYSVAIGYWYNTATLLPEVNVYASCMKRMKQVWMYPRTGREERWDEPNLKKNKWGYYLNAATKRALVMEMRHILGNKFLRIASRELLAQLSVFEESLSDDGDIPKYGAAKGSHDDLVIGCGLALMAVRQSPRLSRLLLKNNHDRVPTAADLGLSDAPALAQKPNQFIDDEFADNPWAELVAANPDLRNMLTPTGAPPETRRGFPSNPIEGW